MRRASHQGSQLRSWRADDSSLTAPDETSARRETCETELSTLSLEIERIVTAISAGGDLPALVAALQQKERPRQELAHELTQARQDAPARLDRGQLRAELRRRLKGWRGLLARHVPEARGILRLLLPEPIVFTPHPCVRRRYAYRARVHVGRLLSGVIDPTSVASLIFASWNQISGWLRQIAALKRAA